MTERRTELLRFSFMLILFYFLSYLFILMTCLHNYTLSILTVVLKIVLYVFCREFLLHYLFWRFGRPASLASLNHQRAQRSSNGPPSHSSRYDVCKMKARHSRMRNKKAFCSLACALLGFSFTLTVSLSLKIPQVLLKLKKYPHGDKGQVTRSLCFTSK